VSELGPLTTSEVGPVEVLLVPLGATEQHGPHLPLDTDTRLACELARRAASRLGPGVLVAPALPYGSSGEHAGFAGTLSIGQRALELVVVELVRALGSEVGRTVLVNGHGGNAEPVARAVARLRGEGRRVDAWFPHVEGADAHAGWFETSLMLALDPEAVRVDRWARGDVRPLRDLIDELRSAGVRAVSANGVLGNPASASVERGEAMWQRLVDDLVAHVRQGA